MGSYSRKRYATESASFPKSASSAPGSYSYATFADLPASGSTPGNTAFVVATNRLYIWSGVGWYLIATVTNASPTAITGVDGSYSLAIDGTATTITAVSTDPEGFTLTWSYVVSTGSLGSKATVAQADNVFTITPSTDAANEGTFSLTFSVTDGLNGVVSAVSAFTLSFSVTNSKHTAMLAQATATGSNQTFDDASTSNHTITVANDASASTSSPYRHGGYSTYFDGSGDKLNLNGDAEFAFGTNDFTVEFWVYLTSQNGSLTMFCDFRGSSGNGRYPALFLNGDNTLTYWYDSGTRITSNAIDLKAWNHIALTRSGTDVKLFINGQQEGSTFTDSSTQLIGTNAPIFGNDTSASFGVIGYMSDIRILNGTAAYTSNFTPPTQPLTAITNTKFLLGRLPYFKDQSASNHTITLGGDASLKPFSSFDNAAYSEASHGASVHFGTSNGNAIIIPDAAATTSGDYTIEFWIRYNTNKSGSQTLTGVNGQHRIVYNGGRFIDWTSGGTQTYWQTGAGTLYQKEEPGIWTHFAQTRTSGVIKAWINGEGSANTVTDNTSWTTSRFGSEHNSSSENFEGDMADIRITHSAIYSSNFTPPTAPLTTSPTYPAMAIGVSNAFSNAYTLSGAVTGSNATVNMVIGQTVNFTVNASGHPFYIRVSSGGANVSTPAATGQGATSGVVSWTPNTAGTYYYQCGNHAGMIGTIVVTDSANNVKFLLNPETSISDLSQSSAIKCFGDTATSTSQVKFAGTKSIYGDGSGDYVKMPIEPIGTDDFTVEAWIYPTSLGSYATAISGATIGGGLGVVMRIDRWFIGNNTTNQMFTSAANKFVVNQWQHIAMTREGTSLRLFYNGTLFDSGTNSYNLNQTDYVLYAAYTDGSYLSFGGYIQDVRITKGLARYTANFTPPAAELEG